jgi:hypothetical protein
MILHIPTLNNQSAEFDLHPDVVPEYIKAKSLVSISSSKVSFWQRSLFQCKQGQMATRSGVLKHGEKLEFGPRYVF